MKQFARGVLIVRPLASICRETGNAQGHWLTAGDLTHAAALNATVIEHTLEFQFRCNGSDGYLAWLDNVLQIRETANLTSDYHFEVCSSPAHLRDTIYKLNDTNQARMVAGYCWDWISKNDTTQWYIVFPEFKFAMQWNLNDESSLWLIKPESVTEIGCIHTCQGLELDYVGVIIGPDLIVRDGVVIPVHFHPVPIEVPSLLMNRYSAPHNGSFFS